MRSGAPHLLIGAVWAAAANVRRMATGARSGVSRINLQGQVMRGTYVPPRYWR